MFSRRSLTEKKDYKLVRFLFSSDVNAEPKFVKVKLNETFYDLKSRLLQYRDDKSTILVRRQGGTRIDCTVVSS